jgi:AcrR family transcriptional regulator
VSEVPSKREQMREERRKQILDSALAVFSRKGFHASNVSDVAAHAGVSQGTIYWYFNSKEELFDAAIVEFFSDFDAELVTVSLGSETASAKLGALAQRMEALVGDAQPVFGAFFGYWFSSQERPGSAQFWVDLLRKYVGGMAGIIKEGSRTGEFRMVDAEALVWAIAAAYDGLAAYSLLVPDIDVKHISGAFVDALLSGLEAR